MQINKFKKEREGEYVFPRFHPDSVSMAFKRTPSRADIREPKGSIHCLRHTFCSHLVMAGHSLRVVQLLAGHASITTTERYAHLSPDHLEGITDELVL